MAKLNLLDSYQTEVLIKLADCFFEDISINNRLTNKDQSLTEIQEYMDAQLAKFFQLLSKTFSYKIQGNSREEKIIKLFHQLLIIDKISIKSIICVIGDYENTSAYLHQLV